MRTIEKFVYQQIVNLGATKDEVTHTIDNFRRVKSDFTDDCLFKSTRELTRETINNLLRMGYVKFDERKNKYVKNDRH
jgi:hypothetical protein